MSTHIVALTANSRLTPRAPDNPAISSPIAARTGVEPRRTRRRTRLGTPTGAHRRRVAVARHSSTVRTCRSTQARSSPGAPGFYPVLAAIGDDIAGLSGARGVSLLFAVSATICVNGLGVNCSGHARPCSARPPSSCAVRSSSSRGSRPSTPPRCSSWLPPAGSPRTACNATATSGRRWSRC